MTTSTLPAAEIANLHFVTERLAVGGDLSQDVHKAVEQLVELEDLGITHVVDCRLEWSDMDFFAEAQSDISYLHHGMDDAGQNVPAAWFDTAIGWIEQAGPDAVVLTHCHMGINRGPSLGFAVLLHEGWDPVEAIEAIRFARPIANVWYAGDALLWHHGRLGTDPAEDLRRLERWRDDNPLDVVRLIRAQRAAGL